MEIQVRHLLRGFLSPRRLLALQCREELLQIRWGCCCCCCCSFFWATTNNNEQDVLRLGRRFLISKVHTPRTGHTDTGDSLDFFSPALSSSEGQRQKPTTRTRTTRTNSTNDKLAEWGSLHFSLLFPLPLLLLFAKPQNSLQKNSYNTVDFRCNQLFFLRLARRVGALDDDTETLLLFFFPVNKTRQCD